MFACSFASPWLDAIVTFEGVRVMPYDDDGADGYEDDGALGWWWWCEPGRPGICACCSGDERGGRGGRSDDPPAFRGGNARGC